PGLRDGRAGQPDQPQRRARRPDLVLLLPPLPRRVCHRPGPVRRMSTPDGLPEDVAALRRALDATGYLADDALATALFLAVRMGQPILLEGEPGVGKTEAAKALATALAT